MTRTPRLFVALLALCAALPLAAQAPTLTFNGQQDASSSLGRPLNVRVEALPGDTIQFGLNLDPGPTTFMGMSIPIGAGPGLVVTPSGILTDANGVFVDNSIVPSLNPLLEGFKVYGLAVVTGPSYPGGFAFSNGASFTFVRRVEAGPDNAGFVGEPIVANALANTENSPLPAGATYAWSVTESPAGSTFTLDGDDTALPTLTADTPGTYRLELSLIAAGTTGGATDRCRIRVYDLDFAGRTQGGFDAAANLSVTANINGPSGESLNVSGLGTTTTGSVNGSLTAQAPFTHTVAEVTAPGGARASRGLTIVANAGEAADAVVADAAALTIRQGLFDDLEMLLDQALATVDLSAPINTAIAQIPPFEVLNIPAPFPPGLTAFSATVAPTSLTFDPGVDTDLTPTATDLQLTATLNNLQFVFGLTGEILGAPYTDTGTLAVTSADLTVGLMTTVQPDGSFMTTVSTTTLTLNSPTLTLANGTIPAAFLSPLVGGLTTGLEAALAPLLGAAIPPLLDGALNAIPQSFDLGGVTLNLAVSDILYDAGGLGLVFDAGLDQNTTMASGLVYATPNPAPTGFPALAPGTNMPYLAAASIGDDVLNRALLAAWEQGLLNLDFEGALDLGTGAIPLEAAALALAFPGLGLEDLDPMTPVRLSLAQEVAPVITLDGVADVTLHVSDAVLEIEAEMSAGYWAPISRVGVNAEVGLDVVVNTMTNELSFSANGLNTMLFARGARAGLDIAPALAIIGPGLSFIYPGLVGAIPPIAIPDLGGLTFNGVAGLQNEGPAGDFLTLYLD